MHGYSLHCGQTVTFFCSAHWRILQSGGHLCLFYKCNQMLLVLVETARMVEMSPSFPAYIGRNRQSLLHVGFFVVGLPVGVCGFFGRINHSIGHNRLRNEFCFGLT